MANAARTIEQIDQDIDANRRILLNRIHCDPGLSAHAWQNAWGRCPDLHQRERELFVERGAAQEAADRQAHKEWQRQQRAHWAAVRRGAYSLTKSAA